MRCMPTCAASCLTSAEESWQFEPHQAAQKDQHDGNKVATCHGTHLRRTHNPQSSLPPSVSCHAFLVSTHMCWWFIPAFWLAPTHSLCSAQTIAAAGGNLYLNNRTLKHNCCSCCCCCSVLHYPEAYGNPDIPNSSPHRVSKSVCDLDDARLEGKQQAGCCAERQQDSIHGDA
jgi:hypothetical protein